MRTATERFRLVLFAATILAGCAAHAADALSISLPLELQVYQRDTQDQGVVTVSGVAQNGADVIEAKAELAPGATRGKPTDWVQVATKAGIDKGTFTGQLPLAAGGWYGISIRARQGKDVVAEVSIAKVGVGDVFVTAGQSNSANYGKPRQAAKDDRVVYFNGKTFGPAKDPIPGGCGGGGSVWPILGDHIVKAQGVPVCFRSASLTWTEVKNWMPGVKYKKFQLYDNLAKCVGHFGKNGVRAVLWHQGESDSLAKTSAATYCEGLKTVIEALNKDAGYQVPWFVAQASFHPRSKKPQEDEVAKGQQLLWQKGIAHKGAVTDDLGQEYRCDKVHFNQRGLTAHAEKWFDALVTQYKWKVAK